MKYNLFYLLAFLFVFTACQKEEIDPSKDNFLSEMTLDIFISGRDGDKDDKDKEDKFCFELVFPFSVSMPDGTVITLIEKEDWVNVKAWYETHPDVQEKPNLIYPVEVVYEAEDDEEVETIIINSEEEMDELREHCYDDEKECFEFVLPISLTMPDGTSITINDEEDWALIEDWYEAHPDAAAEPSLNYPVDIEFEEGETLTINNDEDLEELEEDCDEWGKEDCFELIFPVSWTLPDGTEVVMNDEEDWDTIEDWYEAHPDVAAEPTLNYPVEIEFEDGTTQTISNEDEMESAKDDCE